MIPYSSIRFEIYVLVYQSKTHSSVENEILFISLKLILQSQNEDVSVLGCCRSVDHLVYYRKVIKEGKKDYNSPFSYYEVGMSGQNSKQ